MDIRGTGGGKAGCRNADPEYFLRGVRAGDCPASALGYWEGHSPPRSPGPLTGRKMSRTVFHAVTF